MGMHAGGMCAEGTVLSVIGVPCKACCVWLCVQEESMMHEGVQDYLAKAEQYKSDLGDKRMTVEHLVLAMSEDPR